MAPRVGLEPTTYWLTANRSTIELPENEIICCAREATSCLFLPRMQLYGNMGLLSSCYPVCYNWSMSQERYIVHVDMDAFFASVEQHDHPEYRGKPVVVGSDPKGGKGRGVVSTCSYEAREFGIHSAMPISIAYRKCPDAVFVKPDMGRYSEVSQQVFEIFEKFTPDVEPIGIDEAFLDITGSYRHFGSPVVTCRKIRSLVKKETGLTCSVGLAPNMMTAKIASDLKKPDALVVVTRKGLKDFLRPLPAGKMWGIGKKTNEILNMNNIRTIGDIAESSPETLTSILGRNGRHAWELANGFDPRRVEYDDTVSSISNEHTFNRDTSDQSKIKDTLMYLSEKVSHRMRKQGIKCRTITLKIRFSDFKTYTRQSTAEEPTNFVDDLYSTCTRLLNNFELVNKEVRLIGVKGSNLCDGVWDTDLFGKNGDRAMKNEKIHKALDAIKDKFGEGAIGFRG